MNLKNRKIIHLLLFISIITLQAIAFSFWYSEIKIQNNLYTSIDKIAKPNEAVSLSNQAIKSYFTANNAFTAYLNSNSAQDYTIYRTAIKKMAADLDQLSSLSTKNNIFKQIIASKLSTEKNVSDLQAELNLIINTNFKAAAKLEDIDFKVKAYNYETVLSSITYDTTKTAIVTKKKGLFGRIGNALSGKTQVDKEEVKSVIKMVFNNQEKSGSFEDQLRNIFKLTENYYKTEVTKLKKINSALKAKDKDLLLINKSILSKSQEIVLIYSSSAQELNRIDYLNSIKKYNASLKDKKKFIFILLITISIITILLLLYTAYSYLLEKNLQQAKINAEISLDKKNQLIGMISHEMRAPLNIISNFSKKLKSLNTNPTLNSNIDSLYFTANSLQITVSQILDFFKNENSKLLLYNTKINLKTEVGSILESLKALAELKQLQIKYNISPDLDQDVWADNVKIHQLFYNIIGNAIKFTKTGSITVETNLIAEGEKLRFDVKITDTGAGIPSEELDKIFDKFYQSKTHHEQISFGAGLGLNLCKNIIELFNGEIAVKSKLNIGTEISFFLILETLKLEQETNQTKLINQFKDTNKELLVVDDDPITLLLLKKLMSKINFKVTTYQEVDAAKEYLSTNEVDLIITDLQICDYSGFDFIEDIKEIKNNNAKIPIIVITGDSYMNTANLEELQIDEILIKPINKEELFFKIYTVLNQ
ncbi:hybrid sensor histidine kinase/response regulator [Flavobacterium sp. XS1P27]|uniref:ATP-binding response regulator n=1 Tax=Flavobacterium sp. XS1P27 TaxID=3401724 RepID=UPI003AAAEEC4